MGASGSYLKAKTDALRIFTRSKADLQALDLQAQIQSQETELEQLENTFRSIKVCFHQANPLSREREPQMAANTSLTLNLPFLCSASSCLLL